MHWSPHSEVAMASVLPATYGGWNRNVFDASKLHTALAFDTRVAFNACAISQLFPVKGSSCSKKLRTSVPRTHVKESRIILFGFPTEQTPICLLTGRPSFRQFQNAAANSSCPGSTGLPAEELVDRSDSTEYNGDFALTGQTQDGSPTLRQAVPSLNNVSDGKGHSLIGNFESGSCISILESTSSESEGSNEPAAATYSNGRSRTPTAGREENDHQTSSVAEKELLAVNEQYTQILKEKADAVVKDLRGSCIFLVGMMGSGKTTVGKILADSLGYCFFDSDKLVEEAAGGTSVAQIFKEGNEEIFRDAETEVLSQLSGLGRLVVATGGGAVKRSSNWSYLRQGITVWLNVPLDALARRVVAVGTQSRPLLVQAASDDSYNQALSCLTDLLKERGTSYANADATVSLQEMASSLGCKDANQVTPIMIAIQVVEEVSKLLKHRQR